MFVISGGSMDPEWKNVLNAQKDIAAFDYFYKKYFKMVNNYVFHRVPDEAIRNEIVSDVFFKAMSKLNTFRLLDSRNCRFSSWLMRITINEINMYYRKVGKHRKLTDSVKTETEIEETNHDVNAGFPEYIEIKTIINNLPVKDKDLIGLRFFQKMSYSEIAEVMKKSENSLKVRMHRLLKKIRKGVNNERFGK